MGRGLVSAFRTLTALPVPGRDATSLATALPYFPLVGLVLGLLVVGAVALLASWPMGAGLAAVLLVVILTRALHLDGLADVADGLGALVDRQRALAIMKDPRLGTFGVLALLLAVLVRLTAVAQLAQLGTWAWILPAMIASRTIQVDLAASYPYARGDGTGAPFINDAGPRHRLAAWLAATALCAILYPPFLLALPAAGGLAHALAIIIRRRLGGVTGDVLGAVGEIVELALLSATAAAGPALHTPAWPGWW